MGQESYEKAERQLLIDACNEALKKANISNGNINFFLSGDLMNQIITSSFAARALSIPYLGVFGACSSSMEGLAMASVIVNSNGAERVLTATSSHNGASEKQFRYPTEYGAQKPPTAQWTVTGAGAAVVAKEGDGPVVTSATIGKVVDMGISDPFNMGAAMAPAAVDTIESHFSDIGVDADYYDYIVTGDLGRVGFDIAYDLLMQHGINIPEEKFGDCGILIYPPIKEVFSGGSGCGCSAVVTYGPLLNKVRSGEYKRILVVATGALLSPLSYQQKESIPCIAHAVSIENG